ncbi:MAG: hypothetical protein ACTSVY_03425 [Candidatus Helarchaeota archaeon]
MGTNLSKLVSPEIIDKKKLKNARIVIDGTNYLIKYLSTIKRSGKILYGEGGEPISHVFGFGYLIVNLFELRVKPIVVLDGIPDEKKRMINRKMQQKIMILWKFHESGNPRLKEVSHQNKYFIFEEMKKDLRHFLSLLGVPCIIAPSEADAQASYLVKIKQADFVFSEDYDCLLYGATRVIKNYHVTEKIVKMLSLRRILHDLGLTRAQLIDLALIIGTDIYQGIHGIGPIKGYKLIHKEKTFENVAKKLNEEIPENLGELRAYYLDPPKVKEIPMFGYPSFRLLKEYLSDKMNPTRLNKFISRVKKAVKKPMKQVSLY